MSCSRADEPLQAFRDVSPQVAANGQLDGAPSGSHVDTQFSITTTVCSATDGALRQMHSDRDDRRRVQFVLGREQAVIELSNAGPSSTTPLGLPDDQAIRLRSG